MRIAGTIFQYLKMHYSDNNYPQEIYLSTKYYDLFVAEYIQILKLEKSTTIDYMKFGKTIIRKSAPTSTADISYDAVVECEEDEHPHLLDDYYTISSSITDIPSVVMYDNKNIKVKDGVYK